MGDSKETGIGLTEEGDDSIFLVALVVKCCMSEHVSVSSLRGWRLSWVEVEVEVALWHSAPAVWP